MQQRNLPTTNPPVQYPVGSITSNNWLLPQAGAVWDVTNDEHLFFNVQKNLRQFIAYGAGSNYFGSSPWSLGSQAAFETFKATGHPETSVTYEVGLRSKLDFDQAWLSSMEAQVNGDYVGRRPVTYLDDMSVGGTFLAGLEASYSFDSPFGAGVVKEIKVSANVTNLGGIRGVSTAVVTSNSGGYQAFPIPPRMAFITLAALFQ